MSARDDLTALIARISNTYVDADNTDFHKEIADSILEAGWQKQAACVMTHTPPFNFAQCETHDETFALGETCRFDGRDMVDVLFEAADEQRGRAVRAEMYLDRVRAIADELMADIPYDTDNEHAHFIGKKLIDTIGGAA